MRVNNIFNCNDPIKLTLFSSISNISIFKYIIGTEKTTIDFTTTVVGEFMYVDLVAPDEDCYLIVKYNNGTEFLRIGNPPTVLFVNYYTSENIAIPYTQYDYDSNIVKEGTLESIGDDLYVTLVDNPIPGFHVVLNKIVSVTIPEKYNMGGDMNGTITLERDSWQLVAIPKTGNVATEFIDKLSEQEGVPGTELVTVCSAYPGHVNKFLTYIPGFTNSTSEHNFQLIYEDGDSLEITGFWVKTKAWTHTENNIVFDWT